MSVLEHALKIGERAIPLYAPDAFPPDDKRSGKAPSVGPGWPTWSATPEAIRRHYARHPGDNVGIRTGNGLAVLDVDPRHGGDVTLAGLEREHGALPDTREVVTGGNGRHLYFAGDAPSWSDGGLELKGDGCQVVAPPSVHPETGRLYVWHPGRAGTPAPLPLWLVRGADEPAPAAPKREQDEDDPLREIPAAEYVERLTGRRPNRQGFVVCPFHGGGGERTPSLKLYGETWTCFGRCAPLPGRSRLGGGIYQFAGLVAGYELPLRGVQFLAVRDALLDAWEPRP